MKTFYCLFLGWHKSNNTDLGKTNTESLSSNKQSDTYRYTMKNKTNLEMLC